MLGGKRDRFWLVAAVLAAILGGCSGSGSSSMSGFAFGKQPEPPRVEPNLFPAQYKTDVADFMRTYLNNPTKVKDAYIGEPVLKPVAGVTYYVTCVRYNPRNSKDQYEGIQTNLAIFLGGRLNQFLPGKPEVCTGLAYQRYPDIESMVP